VGVVRDEAPMGFGDEARELAVHGCDKDVVGSVTPHEGR